jgi:hypothetical protein
MIRFLLSCCDGKVEAIISQCPALSVGVSKESVIVVSTAWVLECYAESVLCFSTGTTHFTVLRYVMLSIITTTITLMLRWYRQLWTENLYFKKVSLKELGLRIQLGHGSSERCWNRGRVAGDDFVVLDVNGVYEVGVNFCDCEKSKPEFIQLLRYGWFPASVDHPKTATTFTVLKFFQLLNFELKASAFKFYNALARLTDNTGLCAPKVRKPTPLLFHHLKHPFHTVGSVSFLHDHYSRIPTYEDAEMSNERI